jgi:hypothetical protein
MKGKGQEEASDVEHTTWCGDSMDVLGKAAGDLAKGGFYPLTQRRQSNENQ